MIDDEGGVAVKARKSWRMPKKPEAPDGFALVPWENLRWWSPETKRWRGFNPGYIAARKGSGR